jgi:hypothetical protein
MIRASLDAFLDMKNYLLLIYLFSQNVEISRSVAIGWIDFVGPPLKGFALIAFRHFKDVLFIPLPWSSPMHLKK